MLFQLKLTLIVPTQLAFESEAEAEAETQAEAGAESE